MNERYVGVTIRDQLDVWTFGSFANVNGDLMNLESMQW